MGLKKYEADFSGIVLCDFNDTYTNYVAVSVVG